ncbi:MAG: 3'(2'),5'-bisphosphate nucleotidase CysQ [Bacteroidetes bacterium]|nr:3'(2'),5'-bisphosphate nucleotidase CysQ [Bacteroidota bacterium]
MDVLLKNEVLFKAIKTSINAGIAITEIYNSDFSFELKEDQSPLTKADIKSNEIIISDLQKIGIPIISEESKQIPFSERKGWNQFWLVDPLDGTKEFLNRNGEFTVNIALIDNQMPIMGIIYLPVKGVLYFAHDEIGAYKIESIFNVDFTFNELIEKSIKIPLIANSEIFTIVASRSHSNKETEDFIEAQKNIHGNVSLISKGSSLKFCMIAEGMADIYPRYGTTMEWDIAAGHAIINASGGKILQINGEAMQYNKEDLRNPFFIASRK